MKSITKQKPLDEIEQALAPFNRIFIIGCGTCATMTRTGGVEEVAEMSNTLQEWGKIVTGSIVIPIACDEMSGVTMEENRQALQGPNAALVMSCALGVQKIASYIDTPVIPALDTLFIGMEDSAGDFHEVCQQCGQCIIGETAGICPLTACHKGLLNGPCGGTNNGKCEVDPDKDCAWTVIYQRLEKQGRLDITRKYQPPKDWQAAPRPRVAKVPSAVASPTA